MLSSLNCSHVDYYFNCCRLEGTGNPSLQFSTRCVHNLAIDWLDENYFASCFPSGDASVCVWDRRSAVRYPAAAGASVASMDSGPLSAALELRNIVDPKSTITSIRFSRTKRGCLGMLSDSGNFKSFDIAKEYISEEHRRSLENTLGQRSSKKYPERIYTKKTQALRPLCSPRNYVMEPSWQKVTAFDFLNLKLSSRPTAVTLLADKRVALFTSPTPYRAVDLSSKNTLFCGSSHQEEVISSLLHPHPTPKNGATQALIEIQERALRTSPESDFDPQTELESSEKPTCFSSREKREKLFSMANLSSVQDALAWLAIPRLRCANGYLLNCEKNKEMLAYDPNLAGLWDLIGRKCLVVRYRSLFHL